MKKVAKRTAEVTMPLLSRGQQRSRRKRARIRRESSCSDLHAAGEEGYGKPNLLAEASVEVPDHGQR